MRVALFSAFDIKLNPYIILFKKALETQGILVRFERDFNLKWLISEGRFYDCIHLHWIKLFYKQGKNTLSTSSNKNFLTTRFINAFFDLMCLVEFIFTILMAKFIKIKVVFTVHDLYDLKKKSPRLQFQHESARRIIFRFSDTIHVHNNHTKDLIIKRYKRKKGISVIPHGNYIEFYKNSISRKDSRRKLGIPDQSFVYLFLGLLRPYKGIEYLIDSFEKMKSNNSMLIVAGKVFGGSSYELKLKKLCQNNKKILFFPEFIPDDEIQVYMNASDIFVLPYKNITTSGATALALSYGLPVIAPNISSFPEFVSCNTGLLYEPEVKNGLLAALQASQKHCWSKNTILNYAHGFDWRNLGPKLADLYN